MSAATETVDASLIRDVVSQTSGVDIGDVAPTTRLADVGLVGLDLLACLAELERRYGVDFPDHLVAALSTVDDLIYYTDVKRTQL